MMLWVNYGLCALAILAMAAEVWLIVTRNKKIRMKGKDDYFSYVLVLLFVVVIFPVSLEYTILTSLRNTLILTVLLGSLGIRRGVMDEGLAKAFYVVPWSSVESVHINEYQTSKVQIVCQAQGRQYKLLFGKYKLKEVLAELEKHVGNIYMQKSLEQVLNMKKPV